jgi:hypothetical protein
VVFPSRPAHASIELFQRHYLVCTAERGGCQSCESRPNFVAFVQEANVYSLELPPVLACFL